MQMKPSKEEIRILLHYEFQLEHNAKTAVKNVNRAKERRVIGLSTVHLFTGGSSDFEMKEPRTWLTNLDLDVHVGEKQTSRQSSWIQV